MGEGTTQSMPVEPKDLATAEPQTVTIVTSPWGRVSTSLVAGGCAGALAKTVIAPLDRTKINFQISSDKRYSLKGALRFVKRTWVEQGVVALWRGNTATIVRIAPSAAIQYASHEQYKRMLQGGENDSVAQKLCKRFAAGALAGVTAQTCTYPLDLARARMAVTRSHEFKHLIHVFRHIKQKEGYRTFYKGYFPTMVGVIPYGGMNFFVYETFKMNHQNIVSNLDMDFLGRNEPSWTARFLYGGIAGACGQTCSYPLDIVRRRMQTAGVTQTTHIYTSVGATLRYVYTNEGLIGGLYKGLSMNWIKGPVSVGISFATFDFLQKWLRYWLS